MAGTRNRNKRTIHPALLNQQEAGRYLCHADNWLRDKAKQHDLFKPSAGGGRQGAASLYHPEHLEIILLHLMSPDTFPADSALATWKKYLANQIVALATGKPRPERTRRAEEEGAKK